MGVLKFDGTDDRLKWTTLASALANVSDGAWTVAALLKLEEVETINAIAYLLSGSGNGTTEAGLSITHTAGNAGVVDVDSGALFSSSLTSTANPYLLVVSKGSGNVIPRLGWKLGSGGSWTHENGDLGLPNQSAATMLEIGAWQAVTDFWPAWMGLVAFWEGAMSDANKEALDDNWQTSDWWNSAHGQPAFLVELNVAGASVIDLAGNATDFTATGTTLDSGETLNSWNFNGDGAVVTYEQEGFRFRNDDGSESAATGAANQDVNLTAAKSVNKRLRMLTDTAGADPPTKRLKLKYRKVGDDGWRDLKS